MTTSLYGQLISVSEKYLGPAAERFMQRQISFHLEKKPEDITAADIRKLADSVKIALEVLTQDKAMVARAVQDIKGITMQEAPI